MILALLLFLPSLARAETNCWNSDRTFYDCTANSGAAVGVSAPVVGGTLESNPANLPSEPTPFGFEVRGSDRSSPKGEAKIGLALVKGFDGLGFGVGSWSKGAFTAPDFAQHFLGPMPQQFREYEAKEKFIPGIRLGTTFVLPKVFFPKFIRFSLGGSLGFGQVSGHVSPQMGAVMRIYGFGFGYSVSSDRLASNMPKTQISVFSAGLFVKRAYAGYSNSIMKSAANRTFSNSVSLRVPYGKWLFYGGWKFQKDHRGAPDDWYEGGLQRQLGKRATIGYEYGYYRYSHSVYLQMFL